VLNSACSIKASEHLEDGIDVIVMLLRNLVANRTNLLHNRVGNQMSSWMLSSSGKLLLRLLRARFGDLPEVAVARVNAADAAQLDLWAERVLSAPTLADVLKNPLKSGLRAQSSVLSRKTPPVRAARDCSASLITLSSALNSDLSSTATSTTAA